MQHCKLHTTGTRRRQGRLVCINDDKSPRSRITIDKMKFSNYNDSNTPIPSFIEVPTTEVFSAANTAPNYPLIETRRPRTSCDIQHEETHRRLYNNNCDCDDDGSISSISESSSFTDESSSSSGSGSSNSSTTSYHQFSLDMSLDLDGMSLASNEESVTRDIFLDQTCDDDVSITDTPSIMFYEQDDTTNSLISHTRTSSASHQLVGHGSYCYPRFHSSRRPVEYNHHNPTIREMIYEQQASTTRARYSTTAAAVTTQQFSKLGTTRNSRLLQSWE
jgi:hypothetical protein